MTRLGLNKLRHRSTAFIGPPCTLCAVLARIDTIEVDDGACVVLLAASDDDELRKPKIALDSFTTFYYPRPLAVDRFDAS